MSGDLLGFGSAALIGAAGVSWYRKLSAVRIPQQRLPYFLAMAAAVCLGAGAFSLGTGLAGGIAAGFGLIAGSVFLALQLQAAQDEREPAVVVGGPILDFTAPDDQGNPFELADLRGKPFLLKFFRGHW